MSFTVRKARAADMDFMIRLADAEGWTPGLSDGDAFYEADPQGFFIGELNKKPIGCISAVSYGDFAFIGLFIVQKEYRGQIYGPLLGRAALEYLKGKNIGVDGVMQKISVYEKFGFKKCHRNIRYQFLLSDAPEGSHNEAGSLSKYLRSAREVSFEAIAAYDRKHFPAHREAFLKQWMYATTHRALVWEENSIIQGLGVLRACQTGFKIGPLFASRFEVADSIFRALALNTQDAPVYLDIMENNELALALVEKYKMQKVFETMRMYTHEQPEALWQEVVGITSFELG